MAFLCSVHIPHSLEKFQQAEADNPEITDVIEINEYAKAEDHEAFLSEAGEAIAALNAMLGAPLVDRLHLEVPHEH